MKFILNFYLLGFCIYFIFEKQIDRLIDKLYEWEW